MMSRHLILYDDACSLCKNAVYKLLKKDSQAIFVFAPLWGETAKAVLKEEYQKLFQLRTIILIENYQEEKQIFIYSKAIFRIYWLLGGIYKWIGCFSFLFPFTNLFYQLVAKHRHQLKVQDPSSKLDSFKDRFLP